MTQVGSLVDTTPPYERILLTSPRKEPSPRFHLSSIITFLICLMHLDRFLTLFFSLDVT